jgi:hypothetical protein
MHGDKHLTEAGLRSRRILIDELLGTSLLMGSEGVHQVVRVRVAHREQPPLGRQALAGRVWLSRAANITGR